MKNSTRILTGGSAIQFKGPRPDDLEKAVTEFNEANPVGTKVNVKKDNGDMFPTVTRSEAWIMGGHTAMVLLEGISGGYMLDRVTPQTGGAS